MPHSAQPQHTNPWAPRTQKRHQQEHRPQRPTESSDPTQHAKGRTGDRPGPRKGATTRRNVTRGACQRGARKGPPFTGPCNAQVDNGNKKLTTLHVAAINRSYLCAMQLVDRVPEQLVAEDREGLTAAPGPSVTGDAAPRPSATRFGQRAERSAVAHAVGGALRMTTYRGWGALFRVVTGNLTYYWALCPRCAGTPPFAHFAPWFSE